MEFHSRGGRGTSPQRPIPKKKKSKKKNPEGRSCLGRGHKFPHGEPRSSYVLKLGLRRRPVMNRYVGVGSECRWECMEIGFLFFFSPRLLVRVFLFW